MDLTDALLDADPLDATEAAAAAAVALTAVGRLDDLPVLLQAALGRGADPARLHEALLSAPLFAGVPRALEALRLWREAAPSSSGPEDDDPPPRRRRERGARLFARIYGGHADAVRGILRGFAPVLERFVVEDAYGRLLSRPALEPRARELLAVAALAAQALPLPLESHVRGALRLGASVDAVRRALEIGARIGGDASLREARSCLDRVLAGRDGGAYESDRERRAGESPAQE